MAKPKKETAQNGKVINSQAAMDKVNGWLGQAAYNLFALSQATDHRYKRAALVAEGVGMSLNLSAEATDVDFAGGAKNAECGG